MNEPTIPKIKKAVAEGFEVSIQEIDSRIRKTANRTSSAMRLLLYPKTSGMKYDDMEEKFDRDHSNLIYACRSDSRS